MRITQIQRVKNQLKETGEVSRNWCLANYISRLSAIVMILKEEGYELEASHRQGDYVYKLVNSPMRTVYEYELVNGVRVPQARQIPV